MYLAQCGCPADNSGVYHTEACVGQLRAELARVRAERDRLFDEVRDEQSESDTMYVMIHGPMPVGRRAAALAEHDRRQASGPGPSAPA